MLKASQNPYAAMMSEFLMDPSMGSMEGYSQGSPLDVPTYMPGGGFGGGMRDIGLAQLSKVNPRAAQLAAARLEAEARVNAMGPFTGFMPGAMIGAPLGALAGAGLGMASTKDQTNWAPALMGGGLGAILGGVTGGGISRALEGQYRRAQAYEEALQGLGDTRRTVTA